jgi:hypothetical protein
MSFRHLDTLTSALKVDLMTLVQFKSSKLGAICTAQLIGLSGCDGRYRHARLASLGSEKVTKAVDTGGWCSIARARFSVMRLVKKLSFTVKVSISGAGGPPEE